MKIKFEVYFGSLSLIFLLIHFWIKYVLMVMGTYRLKESIISCSKNYFFCRIHDCSLLILLSTHVCIPLLPVMYSFSEYL